MRAVSENFTAVPGQGKGLCGNRTVREVPLPQLSVGSHNTPVSFPEQKRNSLSRLLELPSHFLYSVGSICLHKSKPTSSLVLNI